MDVQHGIAYPPEAERTRDYLYMCVRTSIYLEWSYSRDRHTYTLHFSNFDGKVIGDKVNNMLLEKENKKGDW